MRRSQAMFLVGILAAGCASDDSEDPCAEAEALSEEVAAMSWEEIVEIQERFAEWQALGCRVS